MKTGNSRVFCGWGRLVAGAAFFGLAMSSAHAHEFLMKPDRFTVKKGEAVPVHAMASHVFMVSEEMEALSNVEASAKQGNTVTPLKLTENAKGLQLETSFSPATDTPAWLIGHRLGQVWSMTTRGMQEGTRQALEAKGMTVKSSTRYEKFTKTYLNASAGDKRFAEPVGQKLEIVPLTNPAAAKAGSEMQFKVLYDGKPLSTAIWATYDGFSKRENTYAYYTEADAQGILHVKITAPGVWMVRAAHTVKVEGGDVEAHEMRTVMMFEAK